MNQFRKWYCRTFQTVFWLALPMLPYRNPERSYKLEELVTILEKEQVSRPLIVTDPVIDGLGLIDRIKALLKEAGMTAACYADTRPNPTTDMVEAALAVYREQECDSIVAVGGGSPMDCAKAVGACMARPDTELKKMAGILRVRKKTPLLVAVPTTAGTGSETTLAAVIVDSDTRHKYVINDFPLIPSYAILDPSVIHSLPFSVAAATGMDALTHAVEAYIGRSTTKQTRADARKAVRLIFDSIEDAAAHKSEQAEKNMMKAAHLAGRAFTRSYVGYIHAVSHSLSGKYDMPHGQTNATLLPIVLEMYGEAVYGKLAELAICAGMGTQQEEKETLAKRFLTAIREMNEKLGIPATLTGIQEEDVAELSAYADKEANPLYPVPVLWNKTELQEIYRRAMGIEASDTLQEEEE